MAYSLTIGSIRVIFSVMVCMPWTAVVSSDLCGTRTLAASGRARRTQSRARRCQLLLVESDAVWSWSMPAMATRSRNANGGSWAANRDQRLVNDLRSVGFEPEDVDVVVMTHFPGDHIGGATCWDTDDGQPGPIIPTFANALYLGQRIDQPRPASPTNARVLPTATTTGCRCLTAICSKSSTAHSALPPACAPTLHRPDRWKIQTVWVEDGGESLCFLTDACSWASHMDRLARVPSYDLDPMTSIDTSDAFVQRPSSAIRYSSSNMMPL